MPAESASSSFDNSPGVIRLVLGLLACVLCSTPTQGQSNPVYIDDSPQARELLQRADDQRRDNIAESLRLYQELLDEYGHKLAPISPGSQDQFVNVRSLVLRTILNDEELLDRYRIAAAGAAARLSEAEEFETLASTYSLTQPGLDALLRIAQRDIETGRFHSALTILSEARNHPDHLGVRAAHCWHLTGLAAHFLSDAPLRTQALESLEQLGGDGAPLHASLEESTRRAPARSRDRQQFISAGTLAGSLSDLVSEPIWETELESSPLSRRFMDHLDRNDQTVTEFYNRHRRDGQLTTVMPTVAGDLVLINEGHRITAFNRISGREQWHYLDRSNIAARETPDLDRARDPSFVHIAEGRVVTLTGHARDSERTNRGRLICLDLATGELLWTISMDRIGGIDDHDDLFPYGEPLISEGVVVVLARKVTDQFLTSDYLIAVRLDDGAFLWSKHVASTGGIRRSNERPFTTPVLHDGDVYVCSPLGATARIDAQRGDVRWLHRFDVPIMLSNMSGEHEPWEIGRPAISQTSIFVLEPDYRRVAQLDLESGALVQSIAASSSDGWARPAYLLANEHSVYAIGHEVRAFRLERLDTPAWVMDLAATTRMTEPDATPRAIDRPTVRGRVDTIDGALIVPTLEGVMLVDDETGRVLQRLSSEVAVNPAVAEAQIFAAGATELRAFMSFRRAEEILRERLASSPDAVEPALSLLRLGLRVADLSLVLEAADLSVRALAMKDLNQRTAVYRAELFMLLLEARQLNLARTLNDGEALFAILGSVATGPEQRVNYMLDYADWLSAHSIERAVETYQSVLSDPQLSRTAITVMGRERSAADWTTAQLREVMAEHGTQAYAPQADFARLRLSQLTAASEPDPDALLELARDFPLAPASVDATLAAADLLVAANRPRDAIAALAEAIRSGLNEPVSRRQLYSRIVHVCLDAGWNLWAVSLLDQVISRHGDIELTIASDPISATVWREQIGGTATVPYPAIGEVRGEVVLDLAGQLVAAAPTASMEERPILLYEDGLLAYHERPDAEALWGGKVEPVTPTLLAATDSELLLWQRLAPRQHLATMVDRQTGDIRWQLTPLTEALEQAGVLNRPRTVNERMPNGDPFDSREVLPFLTDDALIAVQRSGEVVAIDRNDGKTLLWMIPQGLSHVHHAAMLEGALVLAGLHREPEARGGRGDLSPMLLTIDPSTGEVLLRLEPSGLGGVRWMTLDALGRATLGSGDRLEFVDVLTGQRLWSQIGYSAIESRRGWSTAEGVLFEDRLGQLHHVADATGEMTDGFEEHVRADLRARDLRSVDVINDAIYARYQNRVIRYDESGGVRGADVIVDDGHEYKWLLPGDERLVLVSVASSQQAGRGRRRRSIRYDYRIYLLSDTCRLIGEYKLPEQLQQRIMSTALVNGWLLMSSETRTIAVPMPAGGESSRRN